MNTTRYNGAFTCSAIAIVIAVLAVLMSMPAILSAAVAAAPRDADAKDAFEGLIARHQETVKEDQDRFIGRSVFFAPPRKRAAPPPRPRPAPRSEEPSAPIVTVDPDATRWEGPDIIAVVIDTLWFADGRRIRVGDVKDGIAVIDIKNAPYTARCSYKGWEGEVDFVERSLNFGGKVAGGGDDRSFSAGIVAGETEEERLARQDAFNEAARQEAANAKPDASSGRSVGGRNRAEARRGAREISPEQRRRNREADPNPTVPDE